LGVGGVLTGGGSWVILQAKERSRGEREPMAKDVEKKAAKRRAKEEKRAKKRGGHQIEVEIEWGGPTDAPLLSTGE
jgi:hypothetical protein